jgi:hypothetical protein
MDTVADSVRPMLPVISGSFEEVASTTVPGLLAVRGVQNSGL